MAKEKTFSDATKYAEQITENPDKFSDEVLNLANRFLYLRDKLAENTSINRE